MDEAFSNELENEIINIGTRTALKLIELGADPLTLYIFYCITAKRQSIALHKRIVTIKATEDYCMQGLNWGTQRFRATKKILIDSELIEAIVKKNDLNQVIGHYVKIKYIPLGARGTETHPLANSTGGASLPQILLTNILNTDNIKNIKKEPSDSGNTESPLVLSIVRTDSSHSALLPLTDLERWEMATELNVPLWVVKEVDKNFWEYIEEPKNRKKYKTSYKTIRKWIQMGLSKGSYSNNNEVEVMLLQSQHPDAIREIEELKEYARKEKIVE
jgi:hypothetical protein